MNKMSAQSNSIEMVSSVINRRVGITDGTSSLPSGDPFAQIIANMVNGMQTGQEPATSVDGMQVPMQMLMQGEATTETNENGELTQGEDETTEEDLLMQSIVGMMLATQTVVVDDTAVVATDNPTEETTVTGDTVVGETAETVEVAQVAQTVVSKIEENAPKTNTNSIPNTVEVANQTTKVAETVPQAVAPNEKASQNTVPQQTVVNAPQTKDVQETANKASGIIDANSTESKKTSKDQKSTIVSTAYTKGSEQTTKSSSTQEVFTAQHQFQSAVDVAKQQIKSQPQPQQDDIEIDVDEMQNNITSSKTAIANNTPLQKAEGTEQPSTLVDQLSKGITQKLSLGENEFIIKLKPDALGEITVKLLEKDGKITLSITTANPQTARLLNNDLAILRDVMSPMNVNVHEVVTETQQTPQGQMQQFSNQQQQQAFKQQQEAAHGNNDTYFEEELTDVEQELENDGLSVYI